MKDASHHLHKVQKKVIQEARQEVEQKEKNRNRSKESTNSNEVFALDDPDNKRKGPSDCVRHMTQRERTH